MPHSKLFWVKMLPVLTVSCNGDTEQVRQLLVLSIINNSKSLPCFRKGIELCVIYWKIVMDTLSFAYSSIVKVQRKKTGLIWSFLIWSYDLWSDWWQWPKSWLSFFLTLIQALIIDLAFPGNNWGCEGSDCGLGKGPQEEFWGCSDISILPGNGEPRPTQPTQRPVTTRPTQRPVTTRRPRTTTRRPTRKPVTAQRTTTNSPSTTTSPDTTGQRTCRGHGVFSAPNFDSYCQANCNHYPAYCPPEVCVCDN